MAADYACALLPDRAVLAVRGEDARDFLQGLVSNDVRALAPGRAVYAALLTPQGKYLFDFLLVEAGEGAILLDAERARLPELRQRLMMYRLRARVAIEEPEEPLVVLALLGPGAAPIEGALCIADPRLPALGLRAYLPERAVAGLGLPLVDAAVYDRHRLALGVPDASRDMIPQKAILLESGLEELNGVSFTKGCFVGQELTARTKHRGLVKKRLFPVRLEGGPLPEPGSIITAGGQEVGEMRSGQGERGIALLRLEPALAAIRGEAVLRAGESRLVPEVPGWMRLG